MPSGPVTYQTFASSVVEAGSYIPTNLPVSLFVNGVNEFAAEVHQADLTSSGYYL